MLVIVFSHSRLAYKERVSIEGFYLACLIPSIFRLSFVNPSPNPLHGKFNHTPLLLFIIQIIHPARHLPLFPGFLANLIPLPNVSPAMSKVHSPSPPFLSSHAPNSYLSIRRVKKGFKHTKACILPTSWLCIVFLSFTHSTPCPIFLYTSGLSGVLVPTCRPTNNAFF